MLILGRSTNSRIFYFALDHTEINYKKGVFSIILQGEPKKVAFFIFWDSEIYFSKNEPSRGNFMREIDCTRFRSIKTIP